MLRGIVVTGWLFLVAACVVLLLKTWGLKSRKREEDALTEYLCGCYACADPAPRDQLRLGRWTIKSDYLSEL